VLFESSKNFNPSGAFGIASILAVRNTLSRSFSGKKRRFAIVGGTPFQKTFSKPESLLNLHSAGDFVKPPGGIFRKKTGTAH